MLLSINTWADTPDLDTSTSIVTFPHVTVDNDTAYSNVELLLTPGGNWAVLSFELEPEPDFDISGEWKGNLNVKFKDAIAPPHSITYMRCTNQYYTHSKRK